MKKSKNQSTICYCVCYGDKIEINASNGRLEVFYNKDDAIKQQENIEIKTGQFGDYWVKECIIIHGQIEFGGEDENIG